MSDEDFDLDDFDLEVIWPENEWIEEWDDDYEEWQQEQLELKRDQEAREHPRASRAYGEQADGQYSGHKYNQQRTNRHERRKAKQNPETTPGYRRWRGYES